MTSLLITAIGGDIAQAIATIVREEFPAWRLIGCDLHERHGGSHYVDRVFLAPPASAAEYPAWIARLVREEAVDLCIPMSEAELRHFERAGVRQLGNAQLVMPNAEAIAVGSDKLATARHLSAAGLPAPWTVPVEEADAATRFPCIFKPRRSAGSKGVTVCHSLDEARHLAVHAPDAVLQELLLPADREVTVAIYRTADGRIAVVQLLRRLAGGLTGWAQVIDDPEVKQQCRTLAESLSLRGAINAQLRLTDRGPRIFEINARFSSTVLMRHRLGFRDLVWALQEHTGALPSLSEAAVGAIVVRTQGAAVLPRPVN